MSEAANRDDHFRPVAENGFVTVAKRHELDAAMHIPSADARRAARERHGDDAGDAEEPEPLVTVGAFIVIREAETQPERRGDAHTEKADRRRSAELEIRALFRTRVRLALQFPRDDDVRLGRIASQGGAVIDRKL